MNILKATWNTFQWPIPWKCCFAHTQRCSSNIQWLASENRLEKWLFHWNSALDHHLLLETFWISSNKCWAYKCNKPTYVKHLHRVEFQFCKMAKEKCTPVKAEHNAYDSCRATQRSHCLLRRRGKNDKWLHYVVHIS